MARLRGEALRVILLALRLGIIPEERRDEAERLISDFPADDDVTDPRALVEHDVLSQADVETLRKMLKDGDLPPAPPVPEDFELLELVGRGGMGEVYKAWQHSLRRYVAVKIIKPPADLRQDVIRQFEIEAQAAARLQHSNIVAIHHRGEHNGHYFLVMDYIDGPPLTRVIRDDPLPLKASLGLLEKVARAVHHAHENDVIHRDLKPSNILVDGRGEPQVTDFGLAKDLQTEFTLTRSHAALGTPSYMPPEQAQGRSGEADARSDVYSLGAILYELLIGRPPFQADGIPELLRMVAHDEPVPPRRLDAAVPADVQTICLKCLAKEPERRYQTAQALADDIRRFLSNEPIAARPNSFLYRMRKRLARNKPVTAVATLATVLVIGLVAGWIITLQREMREALEAKRQAEGEKVRAQTAERQGVAATKRAVAEAGKAKAALVKSNTNEAILSGRVEDFRGAVQACEAGRRIEDTRLLRLVQWNAERGRALPWREIAAHPNAIVACSPDLTRLACTDGANAINLWNVPTKNTQSLGEHTGNVLNLLFSPDGGILASGSSDGTVKLWDVARRRPITTLRGHTRDAWPLAFRPDGKVLATGSRDRTVRLWHTANGGLIRVVGAHAEATRSSAFSPDWKTLATVRQHDNVICLWNVENGRPLRALRGHQGDVAQLAFSPNVKDMVLASCSRDGAIVLWNPVDGELVFRLRGHGGPVTDMAFSPDGRRLASTSSDRTVRLWDVGTGEQILTVERPLDGSPPIKFFPDNRRLAIGSIDSIEIWDTRTAEKALALPGIGRRVEGIDISPNGSLLEAWSADQRVFFRLTSKGTPSLMHPRRDWAPSPAVVSPDGRFVATVTTEPNAVTLSDARTGKKVRTLPAGDHRVTALAFSPRPEARIPPQRDQAVRPQVLAWGDANGTVKVHSDTGRLLLGPTRRDGPIAAVLFSPDGTMLAAGSGSGTVRLWDVRRRSNEPSHTLNVGSPVHQMAFRRDGKVLAIDCGPDPVPGGDGAQGGPAATVRLWEVATGRELLVLYGHRQTPVALSFRKDGTRLKSESGDSVRVWDVDPAHNPELPKVQPVSPPRP